ncbi:MAG: hypothetical protein GY702_25200 [Desulfobulbaceae bacterium]|nr:hypothetical protein [Desulfobulbaceae bacterium]
MQEKYASARKPLYFAFVNLEKAFDCVPRDVLWWAMRSLGVEEWVVRAVQSMYANARSRVRVNGQLREEFEVNVGLLEFPGNSCKPMTLSSLRTPTSIALTASRNGR